MQLIDYLTDPRVRAHVAHELGISPAYLWQLATGWHGRKPSTDLCTRIERITAGAVTCEELRPDVPWIRGPKGEPLIDAASWTRREAA